MRKPHTIEVKELVDFIGSESITFASSTRENKRLIIDLQGIIEVSVAGKIQYQGTNPSVATDVYNSITEKY